MPIHVRSQDELIDDLDNQRRMLRKSCRDYDSGDRWEAARIATHIANMVYDKGKTSSLLSQLGVLQDLLFPLSGQPINKKALGCQFPLADIRIINGREYSYEPIYDDANETKTKQPSLPFNRWWSATVYTELPGSLRMSRQGLIMTIRNQDGGSHIDAEIANEAFVAISRSGPFTMVNRSLPFSMGEKMEPGEPIMGLEKAIVRQIGWEVEQTLTDLPMNLTKLRASEIPAYIPPEPKWPDGVSVMTVRDFYIEEVTDQVKAEKRRRPPFA